MARSDSGVGCDQIATGVSFCEGGSALYCCGTPVYVSGDDMEILLCGISHTKAGIHKMVIHCKLCFNVIEFCLAKKEAKNGGR